MDRMTETIARCGWAIQAVEEGAGNLGYAYTIGLTEHSGHPELALANIELDTTARVLNGLGELVRAGRTLLPYTTATVDGLEFALVEVHGAHLRGEVFASWHRIYGWLPSPPPLRVLEVLVPDELLCYEHRGIGPYLAEATCRLWARPNGAARRAHRRPQGR